MTVNNQNEVKSNIYNRESELRKLGYKKVGDRMVLIGKYAYRPKKATYYQVMYFIVKGGELIRRQKTFNFNSLEATTFALRNTGLIITNEYQIFYDQS